MPDQPDTTSPLPDGVLPCPTCRGERCERCAMTGRAHILRVVASHQLADRTGPSRITLWYGPPGTQTMVAASAGHLLDQQVDDILAIFAAHGLTDGIVIDDRRQ